MGAPAMLRLSMVGGGADRLRGVLTVAGSTFIALALLLAGAVVGIGPGDGPYSIGLLNQAGLHPGVVMAMVLLCVPAGAFVGNCVRVGAPARDRRLAAMRMAGATPGDVRRLLVAESAGVALVGSALGALLYVIAHLGWGDTSAPTGAAPVERRLPLDVLPNPFWWVLAVVGVPLTVASFGVLALRRTAITPFGVVRRQPQRPPTWTPIVLFVLGAVPVLTTPVMHVLIGASARVLFIPVILLCFILAGTGLTLGAASVAYQLGRWIAPRTGNPALLIAARRMVASPFTASRASGAVSMAVLLAGAAQGSRAATFAVNYDFDRAFFRQSYELVDLVLIVALTIAAAGLLVVAAEGIVTRRRTLAALVAAGVQRRTLGMAVILETILPLAPTVLMATLSGALAAFFTYNGVEAQAAVIPWVALAIVSLGTIAAATLVTALSLIFLRRSVDVAEVRTPA